MKRRKAARGRNQARKQSLEDARRWYREIAHALPCGYDEIAAVLGMSREQAMHRANTMVHFAVLRVEEGRFQPGEMAARRMQGRENV